MKSFSSIIGANAQTLRETRVKNVVRNTESASRQQVETQKQSFRDKQTKLEDMLDLGATNTQDIATHLKGFNATDFVNRLYPLAIEMACEARTIAIMVNVHNMLFPDNKVEGLDKDDLAILSGIENFV